MSALSDADLERLRADAAELLRDNGRLLTHSRESDGAGGWEDTYTPGPELPCSIAPYRAGGGSTAGDRLSEASTHVVTFPHETEVSSSDQVEVNGVVYVVTAVRRYGAMSVNRRVEVRER